MRPRRLRPYTGAMSRVTPMSTAAGGLLLFLAGCGSEPLGPEPPLMLSVAGTWAYSAPSLTGTVFEDRIACEYELEMELAGVSAFSGTYRDSHLVCVLFGEAQLVGLGDGRIVAGALEGSDVRFDMDAESIHNTGRLTGDRMEGQVELTLVVQHDSRIDTTLVTGRWSAVR
jgi:hypothetical protein